MTDVVIESLRPKGHTAAAIREAMALLRNEHAAITQRMSDEAARWADLLLSGTPSAIKGAEKARLDDELNLKRLDALAAELSKRLTEAAAIEAGAARAEQVRDAAAKIEAFNLAFRTQYEAHARAIAEIVELERLAWRAIEALRDPATRAPSADLPALSRAYVNRDARGLGFLVRLPAAEPGAPIVWP
jgi:hypothetical protein